MRTPVRLGPSGAPVSQQRAALDARQRGACRSHDRSQTCGQQQQQRHAGERGRGGGGEGEGEGRVCVSVKEDQD